MSTNLPVCILVRGSTKHRDVIRQLRAGQSVRNTAKITGKGTSTVQRVSRAMIRKKPANPTNPPHD